MTREYPGDNFVLDFPCYCHSEKMLGFLKTEDVPGMLFWLLMH